MNDNHLQDNDYADRDIRVKPLAIFLVATLVVTLVTILGVRVLFKHYSAGMEYDAETAQQLIDARPTNAVVEGSGDAAEALRRLRADEDARLNHYRWVSADSDFVQIPIARAMELIVDKGLPARKDAEGNH